MYQALVSYFELFDNFVTIRIIFITAEEMFGLIYSIKIPWRGGDGGEGTLKGSLGRGLLPKGLQTFILFKQKTILFTSLFKIRKLIS